MPGRLLIGSVTAPTLGRKCNLPLPVARARTAALARGTGQDVPVRGVMRSQRRGLVVTFVAVATFLAMSCPLGASSSRGAPSACDGSTIQARVIENAAGTAPTGIALMNVGTTTCSLRGYPYVQAHGLEGQRWNEGLWEYRNVPSTSKNSPPHMPVVALKPDGEADAGFHVAWRNWCTNPPTSLTLHFGNTHAPPVDVPLDADTNLAAVAPCTTGGTDVGANTLLTSVVHHYDVATGIARS